MVNKDEVKKEIVFTKAGVKVPVRKENLIKGVTWESELVSYSEINKLGTLNLRVACIEPEVEEGTLVALKMRGEFERDPDRQIVKDNNETNGIILPNLLKIDLSNKVPRAMVTPEGEKYNVTSWAGFLVELANYFESINKINDSNIPIDDYAGRKRYLISSENKHRSGALFIGTHKTKKGLHIETNYPSNIIVKNSIHLIEYCNENPSRFKIILN